MHASTTPAPLTQEIVDTPIGGLALIVDEAGALHMVEFADCLGRIERWLTRALGGPRSSLREGRVADMVRADFAAYFGGELEALDRLPVALTGTAFQKEVWAALRRIEPGRHVRLWRVRAKARPSAIGARRRPRQRRQPAGDRGAVPPPGRGRRRPDQLRRRHRAQALAARSRGAARCGQDRHYRRCPPLPVKNGERVRVSICVWRQGAIGLQRRFWLMRVLARTMSLRMTATRATLAGFPAWRSRLAKAARPAL